MADGAIGTGESSAELDPVYVAPNPAASFRSAAARPRRMGWRGWVGAVAAALRALGAFDLASSLDACGRSAHCTRCNECGDDFARVEIRASCDVRCCPWCARRASAERVERVGAAVELLPGIIAARRVSALARVDAAELVAREAAEHWAKAAEAARAARARRVAYWAERAARARARGSEKGLAGALERLKAAEGLGAVERAARAKEGAARARVSTARRERHAIRESDSLRLDGGVRAGAWRWKLITISPKWAPKDRGEVSVAGLRRRVDDVLARWAMCWAAGAKAGGLAAAYASVELSAGGHVHVHVLYLGPYVASSWWARVAGCFVDVRAVDDVPGADVSMPGPGALREALKYALKSPSVWSRRWLEGEARTVAHPLLAAAWVMATRRHQIARAYGTFRVALGELEDNEKLEVAPCVELCASCGAEIPSAAPAVLRETVDVVKALRERWSFRGGVHPRAGPLPPRVKITSW